MLSDGKKTRSKPLYVQLADRLANDIESGVYTVGQRLPSLHQFCDRFDVSYVTMQKSLKRIQDIGYTRSSLGRKGTVVVSRNPHRKKQAVTLIGCFLRPIRAKTDYDNFGNDLITATRSEISTRGYYMADYCVDNPTSMDGFAQVMEANKLHCVLVDNMLADAVLPLTQKYSVPVVLMDSVSKLPNVFSVAPDYDTVGRHSVEMFVKKGYRTLRLYPHAWPGSYEKPHLYHRLLTIYAGFCRQCRDTGISPVLLEDPSTSQSPFSEFADFVLSQPDSANLIVSIRMLDNLRKHMRYMGTKKHAGLAGVADIAVNRDKQPGLSEWRVDPTAIAQKAIEVMQAIIEGEEVEKTTVVPTPWIDRHSV